MVHLVYHGECSYIKSVKWEEFKKYPNFYLDKAIEIKRCKRRIQCNKNHKVIMSFIK